MRYLIRPRRKLRLEGQGPIQFVRRRLRLLDQRGNDRLGVLVGCLRQCDATRVPCDQGRDVAVVWTRTTDRLPNDEVLPDLRGQTMIMRSSPKSGS